MNIFLHFWQALKDLVEELRAYRRSVREAHAAFRRSNGLTELPDDDAPTEIIDVEPVVPDEPRVPVEPQAPEASRPRSRPSRRR